MKRKYLIQCPVCKMYHEANTGFFAPKKIDCNCGYTISIKEDRYITKACPSCGNIITFDQAAGEDAECPICQAKVNTIDSKIQFTTIECPECSMNLQIDKSAKFFNCPLCNKNIDVQTEILKKNAKIDFKPSIIKFDGNKDMLVWKHPMDNFCEGSQLIVHETQEAIFYKNGQFIDKFCAGRYTLDTANYPVLDGVYKIPVDGEIVFHSEIYFVNLATIMGIKWGTDSKVRLFDPASGLHLELGACGQFAIQVIDAKRFLLQLVGTESHTELRNDGTSEDVLNNKNTIISKFKSIIISKIKSCLAKAIRENNINILEVDEHLDELSAFIKDDINIVMQNYGLTIPEFHITTIQTPDDDANFKRLKSQYAEQYLKVRDENIKKATAIAAAERQYVEATTESKLKIISSQGEAEALKLKAEAEAEAYKIQAMAEADEMKAKGYTYEQETARLVGLGVTENLQINQGSACQSVFGDVVGLGLGAVSSVIDLTKKAMSPIESDQKIYDNTNIWDCCKCGKADNNGKFCSNCGEKKPE